MDGRETTIDTAFGAPIGWSPRGNRAVRWEQSVPEVLVIGAGISGLACAHAIRENLPGVELDILEAAPGAGGVIGTQQVAGHLFDDGPGGWLDRDPSTQRLVEGLGLGGSVIHGDKANRRRFVWKDGRLRRFPSDIGSFLSTDLLSLRDKARVLCEPLVRWDPTSEDRSVAAFFERRLGRGPMRALIDPVVAGMYAGRPESLSLQATLPALARHVRERSSLVGLAWDVRAAGPGVGGGYVSLREGMGALTGALARSLKTHLVTDSPVTKIDRDAGRWRVTVGSASTGRHDEMAADAVVVATPAPVSERLLAGLDEDIAAFFASVVTVPVVVVGLGYDSDHAPDLPGYGHLVPSTESGSVLGVLWSSSIWAGRAESGATVRVILGGWRDTAIHTRDDDTLVEMATEAVSASLGFAAPPAATAVARHDHGLPNYAVGHLERLESMERAVRTLPGLFVIGSATRGAGVNSCTKTALQAATDVVDYCGSLR